MVCEITKEWRNRVGDLTKGANRDSNKADQVDSRGLSDRLVGKITNVCLLKRQIFAVPVGDITKLGAAAVGDITKDSPGTPAAGV